MLEAITAAALTGPQYCISLGDQVEGLAVSSIEDMCCAVTKKVPSILHLVVGLLFWSSHLVDCATCIMSNECMSCNLQPTVLCVVLHGAATVLLVMG